MWYRVKLEVNLSITNQAQSKWYSKCSPIKHALTPVLIIIIALVSRSPFLPCVTFCDSPPRRILGFWGFFPQKNPKNTPKKTQKKPQKTKTKTKTTFGLGSLRLGDGRLGRLGNFVAIRTVRRRDVFATLYAQFKIYPTLQNTFAYTHTHFAKTLDINFFQEDCKNNTGEENIPILAQE